MNVSQQNTAPFTVLIVSAVEVECKAILMGISGPDLLDVPVGTGTPDQPYKIQKNGHHYHLIYGGVGPVAATSSTMQALLTQRYHLVICTGIAGGFDIPNRSLVLSTEVIAADLGVEDDDGFTSLEDLGFGLSKVQTDVSWSSDWKVQLSARGIDLYEGPVLTVSTATGTELTAMKLKERIPAAIAEDMEGFGVCFSSYAMGVPSITIRAISNSVGPRERDKWEIKEALEQLSIGFHALTEVLRPCD